MSYPQNQLAIDLSHWNTVTSWSAVAGSGVIGVIHKFSQGVSYRDPAYPGRAGAAKAAGLMWGRYHFADGSDVDAQVTNAIADLGDDELLALDWEDNPDSQMSLDQAVRFVTMAEIRTGRTPVLYSGNTCKENLDRPNATLSRCRLWLAHYANQPACPPGWTTPWLWQWTSSGRCDGVTGDVDCNGFDGTPAELADAWDGAPVPVPIPVPTPTPVREVTVTIDAPAGVTVTVRGTGGGTVEVA